MNLAEVIEHNRRVRWGALLNKDLGEGTRTGENRVVAASGSATPERARPLSWTVPGMPVSKPRMTQRDKWMKRPCVQAYWEYCNRLKGVVGNQFVPVSVVLHFDIPMPASWSRASRGKMEGTWCRTKPDLDNYIKAVCDALWENDSAIAKITATKVWCEGAGSTSIEITP